MLNKEYRFLTEVGRAPPTLPFLLIAIVGFTALTLYLLVSDSSQFAIAASISIDAIIAAVTILSEYGKRRA